MYKVIVLGDDLFELRLINEILTDEYEVVTFNMESTMMDYLRKYTADLILLDFHMSRKNGMDILTDLNRDPITASIPVVVLIGEKDAELEIRCFQKGAEDMITKPIVPDLVRTRVGRILEFNQLQINLQNRLDEKTRQMETLMLQAITTVANTIDSKDDYKGNHSIQVARYAALLARELGWGNADVNNIYNIGLLHDIGKISVPDSIIHKPGPLNDEEWEIMRRHTILGAEILKDIHIVKTAGAVALHHHERYDGTGYPKGLKGEEIPIEARIICLADAYVAMTNPRVYRECLTPEQAVKELQDCKGTQFDPYLVDLFLKVLAEGDDEKSDIDDMLPDEKLVGPAGESSQLLFKVLQASNTAVKHEAMRDSLTGLFNRSYAEKQINMYLRKKKQGAYFMMDLDNFKQINDCFGHIAGDYALKLLADMLIKITNGEAIICRMGGDEFSLFFHKEISRDRLKDIAASLLKEYEAVKAENPNMEGTSISIGIANVPEDGVSYQELYNAADKALYFSKRQGKNRYCFFNDAMASEADEDHEIIDIHHLKQMMQTQVGENGSYQVPYREFQRIYSFISRCVERKKQAAQLLLLSLRCKNRKLNLPEELEVEMQNLENAIVNSLRRNDVSTRYSSCQLLVVLVDTEAENVKTVEERILHNYEVLQHYTQYQVKCEQATIEGQADAE